LKPVREVVALENKHPRNLEYCREVKDESAVYYYDAKEAICDLLAEKGLFDDARNLAVSPNNPFGRYPSGQLLGESLSGSWYQEAYNNMLSDPRGGVNDTEGHPLFMFPLVLYMDKTGVTVMQRHGLEPVMLSTLILNEKASNKTDKSWRHLRFIPYQDQKSRASNKRERSTKKGQR